MDESRKFELNSKFALSHDSITQDVYYGGDGPAVVLMHELPGMTVGCLRAASRIMECGFKVYFRLFFGHPKQHANVKEFSALRIRHEFNIFTSNGHSPIAGWLRDYAAGQTANAAIAVLASPVCVLPAISFYPSYLSPLFAFL